MNVAIIGARRSANGIGEHIAKYLHRSGARVVCVLGSTGETAALASEGLEKYGIAARPYHDLSEMLSREDLQAAAVCSPAGTHRDFLRACLERGLCVLCEKPFLDPGEGDIGGKLERIFSLARSRGSIVAMNSQWPFSLVPYEKLCGPIVPSDVRTFSIRLSPICSGQAMIPDSLPHVLSILHAALGKGAVSDESFSYREGCMHVRFGYASAHGRCEVSVDLVQEKRQPRSFRFGFDGRIVRRSIEQESYAISFHSGTESLRIPDPLESSVEDFVQACARKREPLIGRDHIFATTMLLKQIYNAYAVKERG